MTVHFPVQCKNLATRTFLASLEGCLTVPVVRLMDDRLAWFELEPHGTWLPLVRPYEARNWNQIPDPSPYRKANRSQPPFLYEWSYAIPEDYQDVKQVVNEHPNRTRQLR